MMDAAYELNGPTFAHAIQSPWMKDVAFLALAAAVQRVVIPGSGGGLRRGRRPLLQEQETRQRGLLGHAHWSVFDPEAERHASRSAALIAALRRHGPVQAHVSIRSLIAAACAPASSRGEVRPRCCISYQSKVRLTWVGMMPALGWERAKILVDAPERTTVKGPTNVVGKSLALVGVV
jgi:hypothetical protein